MYVSKKILSFKFLQKKKKYTHTHTHTHIYIYIDDLLYIYILKDNRHYLYERSHNDITTGLLACHGEILV